MIPFFRKIREGLLTQNKISKYLIYAIGEIVLVVIGILIALQVNNWNENRKLEKKEIGIATELHQELNENIASVKSQLELWQNRDQNILKVSELIASKQVTITNREFDSLMFYVIAFNNFKLKRSKFDRIIASESFEFKQSKSIITEMLILNDAYNTLMAYYQFNVDNYHGLIQPYLIENYKFRNFSNIVSHQETVDSFDFKRLLSDYKFDNIIQSARGNNAPFVYYIKDTIKKMEALKDHLETIYPTIIKA